MKKKTLLRSLSVVILLCISIAALAGARLILAAASVSFERLRDDYLALLREKTGFDVSYQALSHSVLAGLRMSNIVVRDLESSAPVLKIRSVKLKWNLLKLISGSIAEVPGELVVSGVSFDYDDFTQYAMRRRFFSLVESLTNKNRRPQPQDFNIQKEIQTLADALFSLPLQLHIKNMSFIYRDAYIQNQLYIAALKINRPENNKSLQWTLSGKNVLSDLTKKNTSWGTLVLGFSAQARLTPLVEDSFAQLRVFPLRESDYTVSPLNMYFSYARDSISLSLMQSMLPFSLTASADPDFENISVKLSASDLNLFDIVKAKKKNLAIHELKSCFISGEYTALWNKTSGSLNYAAEGNLRADFRTFEKGTLAFKFAGDDSRVRIDFIDIESSIVSAEYAGTFDIKKLRPQGTALIRSVRLANGNRISAELYMESFENESLFFIPQLYFGENSLTAVQLRLIGEGLSRDFTFEAFDYSKADIAGPGAIRLNGSFSAGKQNYVQAQLSAENVFSDSVASAAAWFLPEKQAGPLLSFVPALRPYIFSFDLFFSTDFKTFTYNTPYAVIANTQKDNELLLFSLDGTESVFRIGQFDMLSGGQSVQLEANADIASPKEEIFFSASLFVNSLPYSISGVYAPDRFLNISGDYNFSVSMYTDKKGGFTGSLEASSVPLAINNLLFSYSLSLQGEYKSAEDWNIRFNHIDLSESSGRLRVSPRIALSGFAGPEGLYFNHTAYSDELSSLNGNINVLWAFKENVFDSVSLNLSLADTFSSEMYSIILQAYNPEGIKNSAGDFMENVYFSGEAEIRSLPAARFLKLQNQEHGLSGRITALGTAEDLSVQLHIDKASFNAGTSEVFMEGALGLEDDILALSECNIRYGVLNVQALDGNIALEDFSGSLRGNLSGKLSNDIYFREKNFQSPFSFTLSPLDEDKKLPFKQKSFQADLLLSHLEGSFFDTRENYKIQLIRTPGRFDFYAGLFGEIIGGFSDTGELEVKAGKTFPVRFNLQGTVQNDELFLFVDDIAAEGKTFAKLLDLPVFSLYSGSAVGRGTVTGSVFNPLINAEFRGTDMLIGVPDYLDEKMLCKDFRVKTVDNVFSAADSIFVGEKSGARVSLNADITLEKMDFDTLALQVKTIGKVPAAGRYKMPHGLFTGNAQADITLFVDKETVDVRGFIGVESLDAVITLTPDGELPPSGSDIDTIVDLTITADSKSRLFIPSKTNPFLRGIVTQTEPLRILIDTRFGHSAFTGAFTMKGGEILYLNRTFYVKEASAVLNETMEIFDPRLTARAEIRERTADGSPVRIILSVVNQPLSRLNPSFSSIPVKSQQEIMTLLGRIFLADAGEASANPIALLGGLADYGAQVAVFRGVENRLRDLFKFDIFSLRTMFLQNAFMGALSVNSGQRFTVGNFLDNTTVYIGKYFGDTIYADAMLHLAYDAVSAASNENTAGLKFRPEIGLELPSPFGAIRWSIAPELNSDWKLLVPHTSISISWKFNF
ncbi:translocation/assembly module TamB domain-containing protein [Treponema sp. HNW]|uniref:translocation/assembly module TamB domain-containing protein n=1 Tax=Treponema sp. HNW TaxID=3116654 RepID=UPI003D116DEF